MTNRAKPSAGTQWTRSGEITAGDWANGRRKKVRRVVVDMAADLFHAGHVSFLRRVRSAFPAAHVTVWLQTDEQIIDYKKRPPVARYQERKLVLEACRLVDNVVSAPDKFTTEALAPFDYICHGDDLLRWHDELRERFYGAALRDHKLVMVPYTKGISTTDLIDRCRKRG